MSALEYVEESALVEIFNFTPLRQFKDLDWKTLTVFANFSSFTLQEYFDL